MNTYRADSHASSDGETSQRRKKKKHDNRLLDAELKRIEKEKAEDEYDKWNLKEDEFFKRQLIEQSKIRIDARREEPIDYFMRILLVYKRQVKPGDDLNIESMRRPKKIIDRLNKSETESILEKCELYRKIEDQEDFKKFWDHVQVLCQHHLERVTKFELKRRGNMIMQSVVPEEYNENVEAIIKGKTIKELSNLESQAQSFIDSMESNVDVEFWDTVLNRVQVQKAVLCLEVLYEKYFEGKLDENQISANVTTLIEAPKADPLSPRQVPSNSILQGSKVFSQSDYNSRLEKLRENAFQVELGVLLKQAEKEIELRRARETQFGQEDRNSDSEEHPNEQDEGFLFKELLKKEKTVDPEEEWLFDEFDSKKKVDHLHYLGNRVD